MSVHGVNGNGGLPENQQQKTGVIKKEEFGAGGLFKDAKAGKYEIPVQVDYDGSAYSGMVSFGHTTSVEGDPEIPYAQDEHSVVDDGKLKPDVDWNNVAKATVIGGIGGAVKGVLEKPEGE